MINAPSNLKTNLRAKEAAMLEFFQKLFSADFMPHGMCYFWNPAVLWV
jgi:hypothetical protein